MYNYNYVINMKNVQKFWLKVNKCLVFLLFIVLLIGCTPDTIIIERNITINRTINNTQYINITTVMPCNETGPVINTTYDRSYTLELIRRIKFLEGQQDKYFNDSECNDDLNRTETELEECEEELCDNWNSSWC